MNFNQIKNLQLLNAALGNQVAAKGAKSGDVVSVLIWKSSDSKETIKLSLSEKDNHKRIWFSIISSSRFQSYDAQLWDYEQLILDLDEYLVDVTDDSLQNIVTNLSAYKNHLIYSYLKNTVDSDRKKLADLDFVCFLATILQHNYSQLKSRAM